MAFTVSDFDDLLKLLGQHPEWQAELRRLLVGDQLAAIDARLEAVVDAIGELREAQRQTQAQLQELTALVATLAERQLAFDERLDAFSESMRRSAIRVDELVGDSVEARYKTNLPSYLGRQMKQMSLVIPGDLELVSAAWRTLSERDWRALGQLDALFAGALRESSAPVLIAVEASHVVDLYDVESVVDRAGILAQVGYRTIPAVGGDSIVDEARESAIARDVAILLGGKVEHWPESAA